MLNLLDSDSGKTAGVLTRTIHTRSLAHSFLYKYKVGKD